uniref:Uncharacterized protein n=1 Tax=Alexandrium catenella TaxID=2925 RepID=A0A7S1RKR8_ALECA|mmetsp:Transcript_61849/g.165484  ORF Transcript_61849/g.165484 Transcript_61849/m.165484 type:complete len:362 (+) Transcript_61849:3-1088(+)
MTSPKASSPGAQRPPLAQMPVPETGDAEEAVRLRDLCKWQQEEIARLLLLVDELRKRIEAMGESAVQEGSGSPVAASMEKFGLREVAEARGQQRLKGVFERLYQDACQRITRYSLIRERLLASNALCNQVMAALSTRQAEDGSEVPDFERLNATASAALGGMFYHTDYLFRATCQYAMSQGVENTLFKVRRDFNDFDPNASEDTEQPDHDEARRHGPHRLPGRRSERPRKGGGQPASPRTGSTSVSPAKLKKASPLAEEHASFGQYVQSLKDANMEEEWRPKAGRDKKMMLSSSGDFSTLKAAVLEKGKDGGRANKGAGLVASQSLPALPKGRSLFQSPDSPAAAAAVKLLGATAFDLRQM